MIPWLTRLAQIGATPTEIASLESSYYASPTSVQTALDELIAGIANGDLLVMLTNWRQNGGPFGAAFPGGGLPFGAHVALLTGYPADDVYVISAGTGEKIQLSAIEGTVTKASIDALNLGPSDVGITSPASLGAAALASPIFTGVPAAPTPQLGDATNKIATMAAIAAAIAALVNSAPATLDTLGQIATELQSDESVASALATTVAGKASLTALLAGLPLKAVATSSATLTANSLQPVSNANSTTVANFALPTPATPGRLIQVERQDDGTLTTAAAINVTGSVRGVTGASMPLTLIDESIVFVDTGTTWGTFAGHKTLSALRGYFDVRYTLPGAAGPGQLPALLTDAALSTQEVTLGNVSGTLTCDLSQGSVFVGTVTGAVTGLTFINWPASPAFVEPLLILTQDGTGHAISLSGVSWLPAGSTPSFDTTPGHVNYIPLSSPNQGATIYGDAGTLAVGDAVTGATQSALLAVDGNGRLASGPTAASLLTTTYLSTIVGADNGLASLDSGGDVPLTQLGNVPAITQAAIDALELGPTDVGITSPSVINAAEDLSDTALVTGNQTLTSGERARLDISAGNSACTLPTAPPNATRCAVKIEKVNATPGTFSATLTTGGSDVFNLPGGATSMTLKALFSGATLRYHAADETWVVENADSALGQPLGAIASDASGNVPATALANTPQAPLTSPAPAAYQRAIFDAVAGKWVPESPGLVDITAHTWGGLTVSTANADNSTAINTAIQTLGAVGLRAFLPPGIYKIQNPIVIGNGSSSALSTWTGGLEGAGIPLPTGATTNAGMPASLQTTIQWNGASGSTASMVEVLGPVQSVILRNLLFFGNSTLTGGTLAKGPAWGMTLTSSHQGLYENLAFLGTQSGIQHTTVGVKTVAGISGNCSRDVLNNISVSCVNGVSGAPNYGVLFTNGNLAGGQGNTCYEQYYGLWIQNAAASASFVYGVCFQCCDSNRIRNLNVSNTPGFTASIAYDYSKYNQWPSDCTIDVVELGGANPAAVELGGPASTGIARNRIERISGVNGISPDPGMTNGTWGSPYLHGTVTLGSGVKTIAVPMAATGMPVRVTPLTFAGTPGVVTGAATAHTVTLTSYQPGTTTAQTADTSTVYWELLQP